MQRYTFVVQVHPGEVSTVENLATQERVPLPDLDAVGPQIERWLAALDDGQARVEGARDGRERT